MVRVIDIWVEMTSIHIVPDLFNAVFVLSHFVHLSALSVIDLVGLNIWILFIDPLTFSKGGAVERTSLRVDVSSVIGLLIILWYDLLFEQLVRFSRRILLLVLQHRSDHL